MRFCSLNHYRDGILLVARVLMVTLFVLFGVQKVIGFDHATDYMASVGAPAPALFAVIAVVVEVGLGLLIAIGFLTRPLAILLALYTVVSALIGHRYWSLTGMDHYLAMVNFYKNLSIAGGFLLLAVSGPGRFSVDRK